MADKSMVEYSDYAMESTGLTGMISSGLPEIAGEKTKMKKRKPKERIYVCHTYYHVYVACLKELTLPRAMRGKADLVLSTMSNDFGSLKERAEKSGLFEAVFMFEEKEEHAFPQLARYHEDHGNLVFNLFSRMIFTKLYGKLQQPYVPVDFKKYQDIYVFCDSDPIGYYLNYKKIHYHAVEDGLDCICYYDTARYTSILKYPCSKYIEQPREAMVRRLTQDDKNTILRIFMEDLDTLMTQLTTGAHHEHKVLVLTEPLCELPVREQIFRDIVAKYGKDAQVILKPHPRDVLDYHKLFPDDIVLDGKFPMEILNFIEGLEFDQVVSVYTVPDSIHFAKEKVFLGDDFMDLYEDPQKHRFNEQIF